MIFPGLNDVNFFGWMLQGRQLNKLLKSADSGSAMETHQNFCELYAVNGISQTCHCPLFASLTLNIPLNRSIRKCRSMTMYNEPVVQKINPNSMESTRILKTALMPW